MVYSEFDIKYRDWIKRNVEGDGYGKCISLTEQMVAAFPELRRVPGFYYCPVWGEREHWWCAMADGTIVDPTSEQFPSKGLGVYEEYIGDGSDLPTGICPNCGESVFQGDTVCSESCENAYIAYINSCRW